MNARILWQSDNTMEQLSPRSADQEILYENMLRFAESVARPGTEFTIAFPSESGRYFAPLLRYPRALLGLEIIERIRRAEECGYDAAFAGMCYGEFFLRDARQAVRIPVVAAAESSMMVAQTLGAKFAAVTVAERFVPVMEENIRAHGWQARAICRPVRSWEADIAGAMLAAYAGRPDQLIEEFDKQAQQCVRDGADVVICACNPYGAALSQVGYNEVAGTGVPVVTPLVAMIKQAEMLIDLKRSVGLAKSEGMSSPYRSTPGHIQDDLTSQSIGLSQFRDTNYVPRARVLDAA